LIREEYRMKLWPIIATMVVLLLACSQRGALETVAVPAGGTGFVDKVWTVVDSPGGHGDIYVFLSDGTFVKTVKESVPTVGKWSWDGKQLTVIESALPYQADIDSLTSSYFAITVHFMDREYQVGLVPAAATMPDTTRTVEFDPAQARIIANGYDSAWLFTVDNDRAMLRMNRTTMFFTDGEWVRDCAAVWDYTAYRTYEGGRETIEMQLSTASCIGNNSGAESPLHVILTRGEKRWSGCAVAGKP
jgi:hypothetical protein